MFTQVTEFITGHVESKGHCWELSTATQAKADFVEKACAAKGYHLKAGPCHHDGPAIYTWQKGGLTAKEYGKGDSVFAPLMSLN